MAGLFMEDQGMGKVYVVRHGETDYNLQRRYTGRVDVPLNETGEAQAREAAMALRDRSIDVILSSPLLRARQTAAAIAKELRLSVQLVDEFVERNEGVLEGLTVEEVERLHPDMRGPEVRRDWHHAPAGGESLHDVDARVRRGLFRAMAEWPDHNILVVAHYVVARMIFRHFRRPTMDEFYAFRPENCCVSAYDCGGLERFRAELAAGGGGVQA